MSETTSPHTGQEMFDSLTGFDEIAIVKAFGTTIVTLNDTDRMTFGRALAFTHFRRENQDDKTAKNAALSLTIGQLNKFFVPEESEPGLGEDGLGKAPDPTEPTPEP